MYAVSDYTSGYHFPPWLLSAQRFLYFVQMSDVTKHEYVICHNKTSFITFLYATVITKC